MGTGVKVSLREAREQEASLLSDLALRSKAYWGYPPEFLDACRDELTYTSEDVRHQTFVVAEVADVIVGFYALDRTATAQVELEALFVDPAFIGRGYGRALIEHATKTALAMKATALTIQSDPHAEAFYRAVGAELVGSRESDSIPGRMLPLLTIPLRKETSLPLPAGRGPGG